MARATTKRQRQILLALSAFFAGLTAFYLALSARQQSLVRNDSNAPFGDTSSFSDTKSDSTLAPETIPSDEKSNDSQPESNSQTPLEDPLQPREELMAFLASESRELELVQGDHASLASVERRLREQAQALTKADRQWLAAQAIANDAPVGARFLALALLKRDARRSLPLLERIALASMPAAAARGGHLSRGERLYERALALRLGAVEAVEAVAIQSPLAQATLSRIAANARDKTVAEMATWAEAEAKQGRSFFARYAELLAHGQADATGESK